jgi:hypothetical protein
VGAVRWAGAAAIAECLDGPGASAAVGRSDAAVPAELRHSQLCGNVVDGVRAQGQRQAVEQVQHRSLRVCWSVAAAAAGVLGDGR